jgi:4-amino-4-deoxy-L-arabinose transferase-like glycosyltransferase
MLQPNFSLDEAEQVLFGESLEWGYRFRHPPLMTWLSYGVFELTNTSRQAYFALKYVLMALGFVAYFAAARVVLKDVRLSLLATAGLLTTFVMGFLPHQDLMHTVLLASMLAAMLWLGLRVLHTRALSDYAALGVCVGLGILSKYIFAVGIAGLAVGLLWSGQARARLRNEGVALAVVIAGVLVAPYLSWVITNEYSFFTLAKGITGGHGPALDPVSWLKGTGDLILALIEFAVPFIAIFALLFPASFRRLGPNVDADDKMHLKVLEIAMLSAGVMMLAAVFFVGTEAFKPRWMHQVLMPLPIYCFLRAKLTVQREKPYQWFMIVCAIFALLVVIARFAIWETNIGHCKRCREYQPMDRFASALRDSGFLSGTIVAENYDIGGNLRAEFLDSRVVTPGYPLAVFGPPKPGAGQCLYVWQGDKPMPKAMIQYGSDALSAPADNTIRRGRVAAHYLKSQNRMSVLQYELLPEGKGACR